MVRTNDGDTIKSNLIITEVQKRPCLYDTRNRNYIDRCEKARCWNEVCANVVPGWDLLGLEQKFIAGKEVQKRWRSIRDAFTKAYRQGKCLQPEQCSPGSRRFLHHKQMSFLLKALQNKKARYSLDKYESCSEVSNSPQHVQTDEFALKCKTEDLERPLDLKKIDTKSNTSENCCQFTDTIPDNETIERSVETQTNNTNGTDVNKTLMDIKTEPNTSFSDDLFDDDKMFMNSLIPMFKKMNDDTKLLCRIEVLKVVRYALKGGNIFENFKQISDTLFRKRFQNELSTGEDGKTSDLLVNKSTDSNLSMVTRSADGSRPLRKRKMRSPSPSVPPVKKRGPGRPRKIRPPSSESECDAEQKKRGPKKVIQLIESSPLSRSEPQLSELDEKLRLATSVSQLETPVFMQMYNLERAKHTSLAINPMATFTPSMEVSVKTEPIEIIEHPPC